jgi:hypothetical protein
MMITRQEVLIVTSPRNHFCRDADEVISLRRLPTVRNDRNHLRRECVWFGRIDSLSVTSLRFAKVICSHATSAYKPG